MPPKLLFIVLYVVSSTTTNHTGKMENIYVMQTGDRMKKYTCKIEITIHAKSRKEAWNKTQLTAERVRGWVSSVHEEKTET